MRTFTEIDFWLNIVIGWVFAVGLFRVYFIVAKRYSIVDVPNSRSSHSELTIRGAGIVFPIFFLVYNYFGKNVDFTLLAGLMLASLIGFLDDLKPLKPSWRMLVYSLALCFWLWGIETAWWMKIAALIFALGILNAYNFMDGINGITALYSLVSVGSLWYVFTQTDVSLHLKFESLSWGYFGLMISFLAFSLFNVRRKALCFSGDIGAISVAFVLCYGLFQLILHFENATYLLMLGVYGLDALATISLRFVRMEKLWEAHRSHFYQYLSNERKWSHVGVSLLYAILQLILNFFIIQKMFVVTWIAFIILIGFYVAIRLKWEGKHRLFVRYKLG